MSQLPLITVNGVTQTATYLSDDTFYKYYLFAFTNVNVSNGYNQITFYKNTPCDILLVGGGGGGSYDYGGGGGAGGLVFIKSVTFPANAYNFILGAGGTGGTSGSPNGGKGGNTSIKLTNSTNVLVAQGGGGAGYNSSTNINGGCGGGVYNTIYTGGSALNLGESVITFNGTTGVKYGNNGGNRIMNMYSSGGGGAGTAGREGSFDGTGGTGGDGIHIVAANSIFYSIANLFGTSLYGVNNDNNDRRYFAGGGGGGGFSPAGAGGKGGGGAGRGINGAQGFDGGINTGGGAGAGGYGGNGGTGGTGIILIKFGVINQYTATFNANGKGTGTSKTQDYNTSVSLPTLKAVGYTFGGWATTNTATTADVTAAFNMPVGGRTLYAIWTENANKTVSFSELQTVFGGSHPISMSEYQVNIGKTANTLTTLSGDFKGKGVSIDDVLSGNVLSGNVLSGNKAANLNTIGVTTTDPDRNADDGYVRISNIDFPFYYLGVDYGNNNNNGIWWNTNLALTFGNYSFQFTAWSANTARGILFGQKDSMYIGYYFMPTSFINGYYIKRLILYSRDNGTSYKSTWEIRLIRGPDFQYIELNANEMSSTAGQWTASDMNNFFDMFGIYAISNNYNTIPITAGQSLVLRSDLNGYNWECFKQHYVNIIDNDDVLYLPLAASGTVITEILIFEIKALTSIIITGFDVVLLNDFNNINVRIYYRHGRITDVGVKTNSSLWVYSGQTTVSGSGSSIVNIPITLSLNVSANQYICFNIVCNGNYAIICNSGVEFATKFATNDKLEVNTGYGGNTDGVLDNWPSTAYDNTKYNFAGNIKYQF
jgi:uncharacterized repeat protein (TIGR02543 family)